MTSQAVCRVHKAYLKQSESPLLKKILHANEQLAAEHLIDQHIIQRLTEALKQEKKRRKRGARLNLMREHEAGSQFFSPIKVQTARNFQVSKEQKKLKKQKNLVEKRAQSVVNKALKEKAKFERSSAAVEKRRLKDEVLQTKAAEKQTQKKFNFAARRSQQLIVKPKMSNRSSKEVINDYGHVANDDEGTASGKGKNENVLTTLRGRRVRPPKIYDV